MVTQTRLQAFATLSAGIVHATDVPASSTVTLRPLCPLCALPVRVTRWTCSRVVGSRGPGQLRARSKQYPSATSFTRWLEVQSDKQVCFEPAALQIWGHKCSISAPQFSSSVNFTGIVVVVIEVPGVLVVVVCVCVDVDLDSSSHSRATKSEVCIHVCRIRDGTLQLPRIMMDCPQELEAERKVLPC